MRGLRRRPVDDSGASLILALAFMTFLGLVVGSLLTYGGTSLRSTNATEAKAQSAYDIDGALQAGVETVRTRFPTFTNAPLLPPCPPLSLQGPNTGSPVMVTCAGVDGTGAVGSLVEVNPNNRPKNALLTLGTAETGVDKGSNNILRVKGNVYINNAPRSIEQSGSSCPVAPQPPTVPNCSEVWVEAGTVTAKGTCGGRIVADAVTCNDPAPHPDGADPAYAQPADALDYRPVPSCGAGPTVTFEPGYYDDVVALNNTTNGPGCKGKTLWFKPGIYFFDFHNGDGAPLPAAPPEGRVWTIKDKDTKVVGGTPKGWVPGVTAPSLPGACVSPLDVALPNVGVQFVFGGDSRLDVQDGAVELCGQYSATRPPIALYGAKTGADPLPIGPETAKTDGTGVSTGPLFAPVEKITLADSVPAEAVLNGGAGDVTSEVKLKLVSPPAVPAGSILEKAELVARHREFSVAGSTLKNLTVRFTPNRAGAVPTTRALTSYVDGSGDGPYHEERLDVTAALAGEVHQFGLDGGQVNYTATVAAGEAVTEKLDSVQLVLTWTPPAVRGQQTPIGGSPNCLLEGGGCAMIQVKGPTTKFHVLGTTYAPLARLDVKLNNASTQVFGVGVIARALKLQITASAASTGPLIAVPDIVSVILPKPLEVYFRAYTCPAGQSAICAATPVPNAPWRLWGTARARYENLVPLPTPGYRKVTVLRWTVRQT